MTNIVIIALVLAVVIVCAAIGIPYWHTHRRMTDHFEHDNSEKYLEATGRSAEDVSAGQPGRPWRRRPRPETRTTRRSDPTDRSPGTGTGTL